MKPIGNVADLHAALVEGANASEMFRGVRSVEHKLVPKLGRIQKFLTGGWASNEQHLLRLLKDQAIPHLGYTPRNDWEWLATAQHDGMLTRLLDWTNRTIGRPHRPRMIAP